MTPLADRLRAKTEKTESCWLWTGTLNNAGYGTLTIGRRADGTRRLAYAHRVAYELTNGPIPEGLELDHLCRTPACVRPDHLEAVTHAENMRRAAPTHMRTHCKRGHELAVHAVTHSNGRRQCAICARERIRAWKLAKRTAS